MMELKTKIQAEEGRQDLVITREFDLPVELLFKAYTDADLFEQWMGTNVVKFESRAHGGWRFETKGPDGNVVFSANGVNHEFIPDQRIVRTFEMENTPFPPQLEFLEFEELTPETSRLTILSIYKSPEHRDNHLKMPFAQGLNYAHNRLQELVNNLK